MALVISRVEQIERFLLRKTRLRAWAYAAYSDVEGTSEKSSVEIGIRRSVEEKVRCVRAGACALSCLHLKLLTNRACIRFPLPLFASLSRIVSRGIRQ